jgi:16S rRNA (guanine966-N2)-methyltransferase
MRIIAGACKGRTLKAPTWDGLRPTSDRLRETLFNILAHRIDEARVLDVFAGTGAIGLEALSRGAVQAVFVESDRRAAALIDENAARCGVQDRCVIIRQAAEIALDALRRRDPFDVIVCDPPYDRAELDDVLSRSAALIAPDGIVVLEHAWRRTPPDVAALTLGRTVRSGDSALSFYRPVAPSHQSVGDVAPGS